MFEDFFHYFFQKCIKSTPPHMAPSGQPCHNIAPKSSIFPAVVRALSAATLIIAMLLSGCSSQQVLGAEQLKSAAIEIVSIAAEGELFAAASAENKAPANYEGGHPEYLRRQAEDVAKELRQGRPDASDEAQFNRLRDAAARLTDILSALPSAGDGARWQQSRSQFDGVRRQAEEVRRAF